MTGYEQSLTDPSYYGQILVFTYPLVGNYGIAEEEYDVFGLQKYFESEFVSVRGVVLGEISEKYSHYTAKKSLSDWLEEKEIPVLSGVDTRMLTQKLRSHGVMLGQIIPEGTPILSDIPDPNEMNLVAEVSCEDMEILEPEAPCGVTIVALDTGIKNSILRAFLRRGVRILRCPWDTDISQLEEPFHALFLSNGPGDPQMVSHVIQKNVLYAQKEKLPIFGICLGNQLLALSMGAKTFKMKYGHRGMNQPCQDVNTKRAIVTSQNHGFAVDGESLPDDFEVWFTNLNDGTVEGIRHKTDPIFSVQFHPEAKPGPEDAQYIFDDFICEVKASLS
jgi:carbamoyl-phosphate synthase small subunit